MKSFNVMTEKQMSQVDGGFIPLLLSTIFVLLGLGSAIGLSGAVGSGALKK